MGCRPSGWLPVEIFRLMGLTKVASLFTQNDMVAEFGVNTTCLIRLSLCLEIEYLTQLG